ncbi:MAG: hypothetical protein WDZ62_02605 [Candidatus Pacearchaeota archaeon]
MKHYKKSHNTHNPHHNTHPKKRTKRMDHHKKLILAISIIFALIIISVVYILISSDDLGVEDISEEPSPILEQCEFACNSGQKTSFCNVQRNVDENLRTTCYELATNPDYANYGVESCAEIICETQEEESDFTCEGGLNSEWVDSTSDGSCPEREGMFSRLRDEASDSPPEEGQVCCFYYD